MFVIVCIILQCALKKPGHQTQKQEISARSWLKYNEFSFLAQIEFNILFFRSQDPEDLQLVWRCYNPTMDFEKTIKLL